MHEKRKNQIINQLSVEISKAFKTDSQCINVSTPIDEAESTAALIGEKLCFNILYYSLRNYPACFCGRRKICRALKQAFDGKVKYNGFYYLWTGIAPKDELIKIINSFN